MEADLATRVPPILFMGRAFNERVLADLQGGAVDWIRKARVTYLDSFRVDARSLRLLPRTASLSYNRGARRNTWISATHTNNNSEIRRGLGYIEGAPGSVVRHQKLWPWISFCTYPFQAPPNSCLQNVVQHLPSPTSQ